MNHSDLVQTATDLLSETAEPERWLSAYDHALASLPDDSLIALVDELQRHVSLRGRRAA